MEKKATSPIVPAIIVSLILIVLTIVIYFSGLYAQNWSQYVGFAILVVGIIWAIINHAKEKSNQVTYGNLFGFGFKVAAIITCFMILYTVLAGFIFPDMKQKIIDILTGSVHNTLPIADGSETEIIHISDCQSTFPVFICLPGSSQ